MNSCLKLLAQAAVALSLSINSIPAAIASDTAVGKHLQYPQPFQRSDGKWGYVNAGHCWVIRPQFSYAKTFKEGMAGIGVWGTVNDGYMDITGRVPFVVELGHFPGIFSDGFARIGGWGREKTGFIDKSGRLVIRRQFDEAEDFSEGLAAVGVGDNLQTRKWGFIDRRSKFVINPQFDYAGSFSDGLAVVLIDKRYGFINKAGSLVVDAKFDFARRYSGGLAAVSIDGKWGFINKAGVFVVKPEFEEAYVFSEGVAAVKILGKWGFIDKAGKIIINPTFDEVDTGFSEGLAAIKNDGSWGYIDLLGQSLIKPQFSSARSFEGGLAQVTLSSPYGRTYFINKSGMVLLDPTCSALGKPALPIQSKKLFPIVFPPIPNLNRSKDNAPR